MRRASRSAHIALNQTCSRGSIDNWHGASVVSCAGRGQVDSICRGRAKLRRGRRRPAPLVGHQTRQALNLTPVRPRLRVACVRCTLVLECPRVAHLVTRARASRTRTRLAHARTVRNRAQIRKSLPVRPHHPLPTVLVSRHASLHARCPPGGARGSVSFNAMDEFFCRAR